MDTRTAYPSDVTDEEWAFVAPYLTLLDPDAPQRRHDLREVFDALRWIVRAGSPWRMLPNDLPPWAAVHQQTHNKRSAGSPPAASRRWCMTCGRCCGWPRAGPPTPRR